MAGHQPRRRAVALLAAVVLAAGGGTAIGWAATHQQHSPQPSAAAAGTLSGTAGTPGGTARRGARAAPAPTPAPTPPRVLPASPPVAITIPAIGVQSDLQALGENPDGTIQVPQPGPHYNEAAWYRYSPTPGSLGPAIIEGHVDSAAEGPSVFFRLGALRPGDEVYVTRADASVAVFTVNAVRRYPKTAFPTAAVYGNTDDAALRLITCGGSFDYAARSYRDDIVAFAHLTGEQPPTAPMPAA